MLCMLLRLPLRLHQARRARRRPPPPPCTAMRTAICTLAPNLRTHTTNDARGALGLKLDPHDSDAFVRRRGSVSLFFLHRARGRRRRRAQPRNVRIKVHLGDAKAAPHTPTTPPAASRVLARVVCDVVCVALRAACKPWRRVSWRQAAGSPGSCS